MLVQRFYLVFLLLLGSQTSSAVAINYQVLEQNSTVHMLMSKGSKFVAHFAEPLKRLGSQLRSLTTLIIKKCPLIEKHPVASLTALTASAALLCFVRPIIRFLKDKFPWGCPKVPATRLPDSDPVVPAPIVVQPARKVQEGSQVQPQLPVRQENPMNIVPDATSPEVASTVNNGSPFPSQGTTLLLLHLHRWFHLKMCN